MATLERIPPGPLYCIDRGNCTLTLNSIPILNLSLTLTLTLNLTTVLNLTQIIPKYLRLEGKEGNVLFNDALDTFSLRLYGIRHMVKDHSDSERGNPLPLHGLLFPISSKGSFICIIPQTGISQPLLHWNELSLEGRKEMFYLTTHSTHFTYGYMASDMVKGQSWATFSD